MSQYVQKTTLAPARANVWFRPLGGKILTIPGAGRVLRRLLHDVLPKGKRIWVQVSAGSAEGLWIKVDPYLEALYLTGCSEPEVEADIIKHLGPGDCFYDVGAHIGFYSLMAARLVGQKGRVVAFEPDPANVATLQENVSRNDFRQVEVIPGAVWNHSGHATFQRSATESHAVSSRRGAVVRSNKAAPGPGRIKVETVSLDEIARNHRPPTMIKIDVEGAEAEVLQGATNLLAQTAPVLHVEVHHQATATFLENQLRQNDYKIEWHERHPEFPFPRHLFARRCRTAGMSGESSLSHRP